jgi:hypothetical protein
VRARSVVLLMMLATSIAYSQKNTNPDDGFISDPALRDYVDKTPYQHGSLHGYEDGYQTGDIDFHLQRPQADFSKVKEYRAATRGYVDGDKEQFRTGYRDGYQLGYQDAKEGRPFVAFERLQAAAEGKPVAIAASATDADSVDDSDLATFSPPSKPLKIPMAAIFPPQQPSVEPPAMAAAAAKDSALARIMNNLRRTFMPAVVTPQAVVSGTRR